MARKVHHSSLETRTARLKLAVRRKPYSGPSLARGVALLYRRNKTNGSWVLKASDGHGAYWTKAIAEADDHDESNGKTILNFFEAQDHAKKLAVRSLASWNALSSPAWSFSFAEAPAILSHIQPRLTNPISCM